MQDNTTPPNKAEFMVTLLTDRANELSTKVESFDRDCAMVRENYALSPDDRSILATVYRVRQAKVLRELHKVHARIATWKIRECKESLVNIF